MLVQEIPVQRGHGAGVSAHSCLALVFAVAAVITHAFDVSAASHIRLAGKAPPIGKQRHACRVGQFHPLYRVNIDRQIPVANGLRVDLRGDAKHAGDHQPLNVVRVAVLERLANALLHAIHVGVPGPVPLG